MKMSYRLSAVALFLLAGATVAQMRDTHFQRRAKLPPSTPVQRPLPGGTAQFGDPLFGLNAAQQLAFETGREEFEGVETIEGGLGPVFNGKSCLECHSAGATGGASTVTVTRFGHVDKNGKFDPLDQLGGSLLQRFAIAPAALERVPPQANVVSQRVATSLFGAGLIEAISDDDIQQNARRRQADGVQGRASVVQDVATGQQRVGRFGWKAQQATLLSFSADAYVNEMGITNRFFPTENAPNGNLALLAQFDRVADVEDEINPATGKSAIDVAADFMRLLGAPPPLRLTAAAITGGRLFQSMNCTACHLPMMFTGNSNVSALAHKAVPLYSDLLVHDMGALGDGIEQGSVKPKEMRTAPLWGLRARTSFLHDGRAKTAAEAIRAHDGEGAAARRRFSAASAAEQAQLLAFLGTL